MSDVMYVFTPGKLSRIRNPTFTALITFEDIVARVEAEETMLDERESLTFPALVLSIRPPSEDPSPPP